MHFWKRLHNFVSKAGKGSESGLKIDVYLQKFGPLP